MAATTLTGTTGNDILNSPGSVTSLVQGLAGADTITLALAADEADGGAGNDSIALTRGNSISNVVRGGAGNDTVFFRSAAIFTGFVGLGAGADSIAFASGGGTLINNAQIFGRAGADTIRLNAVTNGTIGGGEDADRLSATAANTLTASKVNGGKGADSIYFNAALTSFASVQAGKGNDTLSFSAAGNIRNTLIAGGKGTDSISIGNSTNTTATVAGGGLADTIRLTAANAGAIIYGDGNGVTALGTNTATGAADGADLIASTAAAATAVVSVYGGGGSDTIRFTQAFSGTNLFNGGSGNDSISIADAGASNYGRGSILGGAGSDTILVGASGVAAGLVSTQLGTINGGEGADRIIISGATASTIASANFATLTGVAQAIISYGAGDRILALTGIASNTFTAIANWSTGNPTLVSMSAASGLNAVNLAAFSGQGNIGVFSNGTDSLIAIKNTAIGGASTFTRIVVKGVDLQLTTTIGQAVALGSTTFGFTVGANVGGGLEITLT